MTASLTESVMDTAEASVAFSCLRYIGGGGCLEFDIVSAKLRPDLPPLKESTANFALVAANSPRTASSFLVNSPILCSQYIADGDRHRDVAFVKIHEPFEGTLNLFKYQNTPIKDTAVLGVVGYPGSSRCRVA
ncbi:hypothetical protein B0H65DRAFT_443212 [Neurospora tetraspora]|uniref:Uncharacterized protein n=1 Tax=Neurospora tetraspora TaxID=94610 RepID=A0AAE0MQT6_9PEZI|nr:hypothetical protein B0H65DRAFT_443212 [Neurospora tetraspora]